MRILEFSDGFESNVEPTIEDLSSALDIDLATTNSNSTVDVATGSGSNTINIGGASSQVNLNGGLSGSAIVDEDNMVSNSALKVPTQQSVKAYVDSLASPLTFAAKTNSDSPYTASTAKVILFDTSGGNSIINLPAAASNSGTRYFIKKTTNDFNTLTIDPNSSEQIDGSSTYILYTIGETVEIICNGSAWHILNHRTDTGWISYSGAWISSGTQPSQGDGTWSFNWRRISDSMLLNFYVLFGTTSSAGTGNYSVALPSGPLIDGSKIGVSPQSYVLGTANFHDTGTQLVLGSALYSSTSALKLAYWASNAALVNAPTSWAAGSPMTLANGDEVFMISNPLPISGWKP